jgi:hypothetical protein
VGLLPAGAGARHLVRRQAPSAPDARLVLDDVRPVGTLALSAARALAGLPFAAEGSAEWHPPLAAAMRRLGVRVEEELVLDTLLAGLS